MLVETVWRITVRFYGSLCVWLLPSINKFCKCDIGCILVSACQWIERKLGHRRSKFEAAMVKINMKFGPRCRLVQLTVSLTLTKSYLDIREAFKCVHSVLLMGLLKFEDVIITDFTTDHQ